MKTLFSGFYVVILCLVIFSVTVLAQVSAAVPAQDTPMTVNGGVLNGKATSLPKPEYPESAREAKASGTVAVRVTIDGTGMVILAEADPYDQRQRTAEDGTKLDPVPVDLMLREAAEKAAYKARFAPTLLNHQPVQVKGTVIYNFVTGDDKVNMAASKTVSGGVLNGSAISLPAPQYPAAAKAVNAQGSVTVQILIDEGGNIIAAAAVSGHPLLRSAAETAAREAKFSPTLLGGPAVKVSGVVTYNFVLPKKPDQ
jgi:TonB family protein